MSAYDLDFDRQSEGYDRCYTCGNRAYSGICPRCDLGESEPHVVSENVQRIWAECRERVNETQAKHAELARAWLSCKTEGERRTAMRRIFGGREQ